MLTFYTLLECIAAVAGQAGAGGDVVDDPALGVEAAGAGAGVHTFVVRAAQPPPAVRVQHALGAAGQRGVAEQPGRAGAGAAGRPGPRHRPRPARARPAGVSRGGYLL